ncbi:monofunctional C1-tetrahydrofolate synthase, mitochondrial isoform X2 [Danio rerio]|uniref:Monofunctional C1-tetrahydrofolate synthase, mitochondrial isoform X2 n=1 Tax=Danio rerio TaxID=7955 RepID=A0AC58I1L6_DANRE
MMRLSVAFRHARRSHSTIQRSRTCVKFLSRENRHTPDISAVSFLRAREASSTSGTTETAASLQSHARKYEGPPYERAVGDIVQRCREELKSIGENNPGLKPTLAIIQAGEDDGLLEMNKKMAGKIGLNVMQICLPHRCTEEEVIEEVLRLNKDSRVHGIFLHLPQTFLSKSVRNAIKPQKDVDGVCDLNVGRVVLGDKTDGFTSPVAGAVLELLAKHDAPLVGKMAVLVGLEGPLKVALQCLLQNNGMILQTCRWSSTNLQKQIMDSDVVITLNTNQNHIPSTWLRPGVAAINLGSALLEEHPDSWEATVEAQSAAGLGPLTAAFRMQHVVRSSRRWIQEQQYQPWNIRPLKLHPLSPVPSDIEISRAQTPKPISQLAQEIGLLPEELEAYGNTKAKVHLSLLNRLQHQPDGRYVLVAGITPTPLGEGKSTVTIGLAQALTAHLKLNSFACLRQPSQGPTFGVKGGAAGGGYAQVIPMEEFNLHLTGDIHAITAANNLVAAAIDARILHEATQSDKALYSRLVPSVNGVRRFSPIQLARLQRLGINKSNPTDLTPQEVSAFVRLDLDPEKVTWQRVVDTNDRFLRKITIGQANTEKGHARQTQFDIAVASEIMAILALTDGLADMRARLGRMVVGSSRNGQAITADDLGVTGALAVLMKDAIKPTLMQTLEGTPVFVHAGPFANIAHGNSSVLADKLALKLVGEEGYVAMCSRH